jgi:hypothetical protein
MSERHTVFTCPVCHVAITRPLLPLRPDQSICLEDGKPAVPKGFFGINKQEYWSVAGHVLVNLGDLVGTEHSGGNNGCCGLDGLDGPNLVCANGHEVGTEKSDCWMPHAAVLLYNVIGIDKC